MHEASNNSVTQLLASAEHGDSQAAEQLLTIVYEDLRRLAHQQMQPERADHTLTATALVHEAYLRLIDHESKSSHVTWANRRHFFGAAARAMRRILVDWARKKQSSKHGGDHGRRPLDTGVAIVHAPDDSIVDLDEALSRLEQRDARKAHVVSLRFFAGLTLEETASVLGFSQRTIDNDWQFARAWLHRALAEESPNANGKTHHD